MALCRRERLGLWRTVVVPGGRCHDVTTSRNLGPLNGSPLFHERDIQRIEGEMTSRPAARLVSPMISPVLSGVIH